MLKTTSNLPGQEEPLSPWDETHLTVSLLMDESVQLRLAWNCSTPADTYCWVILENIFSNLTCWLETDDLMTQSAVFFSLLIEGIVWTYAKLNLLFRGTVWSVGLPTNDVGGKSVVPSCCSKYKLTRVPLENFSVLLCIEPSVRIRGKAEQILSAANCLSHSMISTNPVGKVLDYMQTL